MTANSATLTEPIERRSGSPAASSVEATSGLQPPPIDSSRPPPPPTNGSCLRQTVRDAGEHQPDQQVPVDIALPQVGRARHAGRRDLGRVHSGAGEHRGHAERQEGGAGDDAKRHPERPVNELSRESDADKWGDRAKFPETVEHAC